MGESEDGKLREVRSGEEAQIDLRENGDFRIFYSLIGYFNRKIEDKAHESYQGESSESSCDAEAEAVESRPNFSRRNERRSAKRTNFQERIVAISSSETKQKMI